MNKFLVTRYHNGTLIDSLVFDTKAEAELGLLQCEEGDDKHDPCEYVIEKEIQKESKGNT
jgi:hypothetical protein